MFRLIYISGETMMLTQAVLEDILTKAREKNSGLGVTGLLLHKDGNFLQVLEGEEQTVRTLFEEIRRDPRHRRVACVLEETVEERDFKDWSMAFRRLDADTEVPSGFSNLLVIPWDQLDLAKYSATIGNFIKLFKQATA